MMTFIFNYKQKADTVRNLNGKIVLIPNLTSSDICHLTMARPSKLPQNVPVKI